MTTKIVPGLITIMAFAGTAMLWRDDARAARGLAVNVDTIHREVIPSFSRQTGLACNVCHTTFPQLTSFGRRFKLNGYTLTGLQVVEAGAPKTSLKIDRKSTRLNSSHTVISYAVFCLKKKR